MHSTTDANSTSANLSPKHTIKGKSGNATNLIAMAMAAAMTPTTTTMMMPTTSVVSTPQPTGNDIVSDSNSLDYFPQLMAVEPRYNEGPRNWQNLFAITRFRYIEAHFHIFYYY